MAASLAIPARFGENFPFPGPSCGVMLGVAELDGESEAMMNPEPLPTQETDLAHSIVGVWGLTAREDFDQDGDLLIDPHLGADPIGMLTFSQDHFSAQFSKRDRSDPSETVSVQTANNSAAVNGYDAYFGSYWIDETGEAIVVHLDGSITPANTGQEFTRITRASDARLLIRLDTSTDEGTPIMRTLTFKRLS